MRPTATVLLVGLETTYAVASDLMLGTIVVLSGPSRAGKSTIAARIQDSLDGIWMHVVMDLHIQATPPGRSAAPAARA